jgi:hypothetical protein
MPVGFVVTLLLGLGAAGMLPVRGTVGNLDLRPSGDESRLTADDCWSRTAPTDMRGVVPGHVLVSVGGGPVRYSARMVGPALAHVFHDEHPRLRVLAFCR